MCGEFLYLQESKYFISAESNIRIAVSYLKMNIYLSERQNSVVRRTDRVKERGREGERDSPIHWYTSPSGCCSQDWSRPKPGARNFITVTHVGDRGPTVGPSTAAFQGAFAGSWIGSRSAWICRGIYIGSRPHMQWLNLCTTRPASKIAIFFKNNVEIIILNLPF